MCIGASRGSPAELFLRFLAFLGALAPRAVGISVVRPFSEDVFSEIHTFGVAGQPHLGFPGCAHAAKLGDGSVFAGLFRVSVWTSSVIRFVVGFGHPLVAFGGVLRGSQGVFWAEFSALNATFSNLWFLKDVFNEIITFGSLKWSLTDTKCETCSLLSGVCVLLLE